MTMCGCDAKSTMPIFLSLMVIGIMSLKYLSVPNQTTYQDESQFIFTIVVWNTLNMADLLLKNTIESSRRYEITKTIGMALMGE